MAETLGISSFALTGTISNIRLETIGNLMGLLVMFYLEKVIFIEGKRDIEGFLKSDTVTCRINPLITQFLSLVPLKKF